MTVDIVFADDSLGGTSRSALTMGEAWRRAGHEVRFRPQIAPHVERAAAFAAVGEILRPGDPTPLAPVVHLHHAAWSARHRAAALALAERARRSSEPPRLITHNIFAVADRVLDAWPGPRTVGVLGAWAAEQYRWSMAGVPGAPSPVVVPNPQDTRLFSRSSPSDRADARSRLHIGPHERLVLRVGSPHPDKWSRAYVNVIRRQRGIRFLLVGAPRELVEAVRGEPHVTTWDATGDESTVLSAYAAADVFAHAADRGESFGNVLIEALLTGLPVVSLARRYRDNTPWEFRTLSGFRYVTRLDEWERAVADAPGRDDASVDTAVAAARYGLASVSDALALLADGSPSGAAPERPGVIDRVRIGVLHNPVATAAKGARLRRRGILS